MNIGVIRQRYVASGGAERYLNAVVQALAAAGHQVHVFARTWDAATAGQYQLRRVPVIRWPSFLRGWSFAVNCRRAIERSPCDLIFSLERTIHQDVYRAGDGCHREWLRQRRRFLPWWQRARVRCNPLHTTLLALERRTLSPDYTGWIIANSNRGRAEILRHYGFPETRIQVIYNGVDLERFQPPRESSGAAPDPNAPRVLLFVGSGFERKGLAFAIAALARLPDCYRLHVAGKGRLAPYRRLAARLGVADRVKHLGFDIDTAALYPRAHLLVHPAIYEPFANVCLEALACGLPVVTTRVNGAAEIIEPGVNGAIIDQPNNAAELAEAIAQFADPERRRAAGAAARRTAEAHPFDRNVAETLGALERAWREKKRRIGCGGSK